MYIKNLKKNYQERWENAYFTVKNPRASRPRAVLTVFVGKKFLGPLWPDQHNTRIFLLGSFSFPTEYTRMTHLEEFYVLPSP